ncbi:MAG: MAPEG family protein [Pseudomonadota bacterium]
MSAELTYLVWTIALTAVMWFPYIVDRIMVRGLSVAVGYDESKPQSPWAQRMQKAHYNAVENLVLFGGLVLVLNAVGISNSTTVLACKVYFWTRLAHYLVYSVGVPWMRTLTFTASWVALVVLILELL